MDKKLVLTKKNQSIIKHLIPTFFFISLLLFQNTSCRDKSKTNKSQGEAQNSLSGTWRLISYSDFDSVTGKWTQPYGEHPRGYFTYTESGIVNLNVSSDPPFNISQDFTKKHVRPLSEFLDNYAFGYFGTYTLDVKNGKVIHHPKGGSLTWYIGTDQDHMFRLKGDTLFIGDPTVEIGRRVLVREK